MLKFTILLSSLLPSIAMAHEWDNEYWLERLFRNHVKVGECLAYTFDNAREDFMNSCSVHSMAYTENELVRELNQQKAQHPEQDDIKFTFEHFSEKQLNDLVEIYQNVAIIPVINSAIISMYIADAIIRTDARMEDK